MCRRSQRLPRKIKAAPRPAKLWKEKTANLHSLEMQLQYLCWDGDIHWGKMTKSLQATPLNPDWIAAIWKTPKDTAEGVGKRNTWVKLSLGRQSHILTMVTCRNCDTIVPVELEVPIPIAYPQEEKTCLGSSFASVLHMAGYY